MRMHRQNRRAGFTLVELLVVIGTIAVLISILIPTLNKARESAQRAACLSNLKQIATLLNMYATTYGGQVPIGFISKGPTATGEGNNYYISIASATPDPDPPKIVRYVGLGLFFKAGYLKESGGGMSNGGSALILFCPSAAGDLFHGFDAVNNRWPPSLSSIRSSYSCRPSTDNLALNASQHATDAVAWQYNTGAPFYPIKVNAGVFDTSVPPAKGAMFQLRKLKNRAIVTDVVSSFDRPMLVHRKGINVLYANGGARFVDLKLVTPQLYSGVSQFSSSGDYMCDRIWNNLDADAQLYPTNP